MMSKPPPRYTIPNEETLGLLHVRHLVEVVPQVPLSLQYGEEHKSSDGEMMEDEGEEKTTEEDEEAVLPT